MAATLLLVFYKNKQGDVLFKVVMNENDATLPQFTPVEGNYYRWSEFKSWCQEVMAAHPEKK